MAQNVQTKQLQASRLFSVEGWVCLVTGGGTGIGLMCAQALAANGVFSTPFELLTFESNPNHDTGAKVYITGRRMEVLESAATTHSPADGPGSIVP